MTFKHFLGFNRAGSARTRRRHVKPPIFELQPLEKRVFLSTTTLTPTHDAFVQDGGTSGTNYGTHVELLAKTAGTGTNRNSYLKFDISSLSSAVDTATLRLYGRNSDATPEDVYVHAYEAANDDWTEGAITWGLPSPQPGIVSGGTSLGSTKVYDNVARWYEIDVTGLIAAQKALNKTVVSIVLRSPYYSTSVPKFNSKDAASNHPQLVVVSNPPAAPSALAATAASSTSINLTWTDNATNESGFKLDRSTSSTFAAGTVTTTTLAANATGASVSGLSASTTYYFRLRATNAAGDSAHSNTASATTPSALPAAPSGVTASVTSPTAVTVAWVDNASNETGFAVDYSTSSTFASNVQTVTAAADATSAGLTGLTSGATYYVRVRAVNGAGASANSAAIPLVTGPALEPTQLLGAAVGSVNSPGDETFDPVLAGGTYTVRGSGADIWGTADAFRYAYYPLSGDATIEARVSFISYTHSSAKGALMVRESLAANARHASAAVHYSAGVSFYARGTTGGSSANVTAQATGLAAPYWVRLTRAGDQLTASRSPDGVAWTSMGTTTLSSLASTVYVGLAVTAHDNNKTCTVRFDNLSIRGNVPEPVAPTDLTATAATATRVDLAWTDPALNEAGYRVERSSDGGATFATLPAAASLAAGTTSFSDATAAASTTYHYRVVAVGPTIDSVTRDSIPSNTASATTPALPAAPTALVAVATSDTEIDLTWTDNASDEFAYELDYSTDPTFATGVVSESLAANATSFTVEDLDADTHYYFRLRATNAAGNSAYATDDETTLFVGPQPPLEVTTAGAATTNEGATYTLALNASGEGASTIDHWFIDWGDGSDPDGVGGVGEIVTGNPATKTHVFADGTAIATIKATAFLPDDPTGTDAEPLRIKVANVAPVATITGVPTTWLGGQTYTLGASATDAGPLDTTFTYHWALVVNNGTPTRGSGTTFDVPVTVAGTYLVTLVATDKDGDDSIVASAAFRMPGTVGYTVTPDAIGTPTGPQDPPDPNDDTAPAQPSSLHQVGEAWIDRVQISWVDNATNEDGYWVQWSNGDSWITIAELGPGATTYIDEYPAFGPQNWRVVAFNEYEFLDEEDLIDADIVESTPSDPVTIHPKAPPVAWYDDNAGANDRDTLSPYNVVHDSEEGLTFSVVPNDIDYDSSTIRIPAGGFTQPSHGTLSLDVPTGVFTYIPAAGFVGTDTFTYWVEDGAGIKSAPATIAVDVTNAIPQALPMSIEYAGEAEATFNGVVYEWGHLGQLSAPDADGDAVTYHIVEGPSSGLLKHDENTGAFVYVPHSTFPGADRFKFKASDGLSESLASVVITSDEVNLAPSGQGSGGLINNGFYEGDPANGQRIKITSLPSNGSVTLTVLDVDGVTQTTVTAAQGVEYRASYGFYAPAGSWGVADDFTYVQMNGPFESKPADIAVRWLPGNMPYNFEPRGAFYATVAAHEATTVSDVLVSGVLINGSPSDFDWVINSGPLHGSVTVQSDGTFTYTPHYDPNDEDDEPYIGWDFFKVSLTNPYHTTERWVQVNVVAVDAVAPVPVTPFEPFPGVMPAVVAGAQAGLQLFAATNESAPSFTQLENDYNATKTLFAELALGWSNLGKAVGNVSTATDLEILEKLDGASTFIQPLADKYDQYLAKLSKLNKAAGRFLASQWYVSHADRDLVMKVNGLPLKIGSLSASKARMEEMADSLKALGEGAGIAVGTAGRVVTYADTTHKVLSYAEMAGGVTVLVKTGATLLVKEGIKACAKAAAKEVMQNVASAVAGELANYAGTLAGLDDEQKQWLKIGVDSYQVFSFIKAARTKVDWNGNCFVAGTQVLVGYDGDGQPVMRNIEDIREGDYVLSRDQYDVGDSIERRRVVNTFVRQSDHLRTVSIRDTSGNVETIQTTDEHPLWVVGKGWTDAGDLRRGDRVAEADGSNDAVVISTARDERPEGITVYNFEVEGDHTYFVTDGHGQGSAIWAHNICIGNKFGARMKGKIFWFDTGIVVTKKFKKRTSQETDAIQDVSDPHKTQFVKNLGLAAQADPSIKQMIMTETKITDPDVADAVIAAMISKGTRPPGFQVHHKDPVEFGGDNSQDNFVLLRNQPHHRAITVEQNEISKAFEPGDEFEVSWPAFTGPIYGGV